MTVNIYKTVNSVKVTQSDPKTVVVTSAPNKVILSKEIGPQGVAGPSAYDIAVSNGYLGTEQEWSAISDVNPIDDSVIEVNKTYSSIKIEERLDEEVGDEELNFTLLFDNQLSQG